MVAALQQQIYVVLVLVVIVGEVVVVVVVVIVVVVVAYSRADALRQVARAKLRLRGMTKDVLRIYIGWEVGWAGWGGGGKRRVQGACSLPGQICACVAVTGGAAGDWR